MEYIYCDEVNLTEEIANALISVADKYNIPQLKSACSTFLASCLTVKNVVDISILAHKVDAHELEKATVRFIVKNVDAVFDENDIKKLPYPILRDVCKQKI